MDEQDFAGIAGLSIIILLGVFFTLKLTNIPNVPIIVQCGLPSQSRSHINFIKFERITIFYKHIFFYFFHFVIKLIQFLYKNLISRMCIVCSKLKRFRYLDKINIYNNKNVTLKISSDIFSVEHLMKRIVAK